MFMEAFATGFSLSSDTKPGYSQENDNYRITFSEVLCDKAKNIVSRGFEHCYNWKHVMDIILGATKEAQTDNVIDIEAFAEDALRDWLVTFNGWGLLSSVLDSRRHRHVLLSLAYTSENWDEETGGEFTEEKIFDTVKFVYDNMPGKELHTLLPKFGVLCEEIPGGGKACQRKKLLTVFFNAKWSLDIRFVLEKKRRNRTLVDLSAEALVQNIFLEEEIARLTIPETLLTTVRAKFHDAEWIRSYWDSQPDKDDKEEDKVQDNEEKIDNVIDKEPDDEVEEEEDSEFLSSMLDDMSGEAMPAGPEERASSEPPPGIDGLLTLWVVIFMIIAFIVYAWS